MNPYDERAEDIAPEQPMQWTDVLTGQQSISLGRDRYREILHSAGLSVSGHAVDEGDNYYCFAEAPCTRS